MQKALARSYSSLASVLLAIRSSSQIRAATRGGPEPALPAQHVPWRESPLTKWLQPQLAPAAAIVVMAAVAPGVESASETLATLNYVCRFRSAHSGGGVVVKPSWDSPRGQARQRPHSGCAHDAADEHEDDTHCHSPPKHLRGRQMHQCAAQLRNHSAHRHHHPQNACPPAAQPHLRRPQSAHVQSSPSPLKRHARRSGAVSLHAAMTPQEEGQAYEQVLQALRRAGCGLREEVLLEKLLQSLGSAREEVRRRSTVLPGRACCALLRRPCTSVQLPPHVPRSVALSGGNSCSCRRSCRRGRMSHVRSYAANLLV